MVKIYSRNIPTTQDLRKIRIFAPRNCSKNNPCDILFMHDAQNLFDNTTSYSKQSWRIIEGMEDSNVSNVIVVGIDNSPTHRLSEYSPYKTSVNKIKEYSGNHGGLGRKYIDWIVKDILPWIKTLHNTTENYYMAGSSMGAYISMFSAIWYPDLFKGIGLFSIASWFNEKAILKDISNTIFNSNTKFFVSVGNKETSSNEIKDFPKIYIQNSKNIIKALNKRGVGRIKFTLFDGEHNELQWMKLFPKFAKFMFK